LRSIAMLCGVIRAIAQRKPPARGCRVEVPYRLVRKLMRQITGGKKSV
jgi:hypothetical protein